MPSNKNGSMTVPLDSVSPDTTLTGKGGPCPNHNWTFRVESVTLDSFDYTLTFDGFDRTGDPYIEITGP
jgi:hypothetical protein